PKSGAKTTAKEMSWWDALVGGIAQGIAVMPGISRSGSTISAMLWRGASSDLAPRFSFLMYLIVSFGVSLLGITDAIEEGLAIGPLIGMTVASFITGYLSLLWLFSLLKKGQFKWFAPYLWFVAAVTLVRVFASGS
ncbi:MAG: undecaprenyl-diphosphate phosphatase, partial [Leptolyngbyaceae cyanobacterium]